MNKKQALNSISYTVLPITIFSVLPYPSLTTDLITTINITVVWWFLIAIVYLIYLTSIKVVSDKATSVLMLTVKLYLLWNIFNIIRGGFIAENYWDWKFLIHNTMGLLLPILAYIVCNPIVLQTLCSYYLKYLLPLFIIFAFLISKDAYGFYLVPISFLLLFLPAVTLRWKIFLLIVALVVITADMGARSNVIKFIVPIIFSLIYYLRNLLSTSFLEWARKLLIIIPILFFCLAVTDIFNIFNMDDYIKGNYETSVAEGSDWEGGGDLKVDTRTFLYVEVLESAEKNNYWWIGRSPARGNESLWFGKDDETGRGERNSNEVGILNVFTWTGLVGVILYCMVFYKASYLALNRSNNIYLKTVGLFVAFRWLYAWVEDINIFSLTYAFLWIMIGICFSKSFRAMTDKEFERWVQGIFDKRLRAI